MINVNYENVAKLVKKENNFLKASGDLIKETYKDFIYFSNMFYVAEKKIKDKKLDKGVAKAIDQELKSLGKDFYQVVKKCTPNHKSAMRKLGKDAEQSVKVVEAKIKDCKDKKKPFKADTIRGLGSLLNVAPTEKTLDEVITDFFKSATKKFDISDAKLIDAIIKNQSKEIAEKDLDNQQSKQLHDIEVAKDMQLVASNS
tara:strand:+ start:13011 stop:13610 length:600 start_codon:yes stop_codon:yes gene_type:complete